MGTVVLFGPTAANLNTVKSSMGAILDCRDALRAVHVRISTLMNCPTTFPYQSEVLVRELEFVVATCERFRQKCISPDTRRQLEVVKLRAWVLRLAVPPMHTALVEADFRKRAVAAQQLGLEASRFFREAYKTFCLPELAAAASRGKARLTPK